MSSRVEVLRFPESKWWDFKYGVLVGGPYPSGRIVSVHLTLRGARWKARRRAAERRAPLPVSVETLDRRRGR